MAIQPRPQPGSLLKWASFGAQVVVIISAIVAVTGWATGSFADWLGATVESYVENIHNDNPQIEIVTYRVTAHTDGVTDTWENPMRAPRIDRANPASTPAAHYRLGIECPAGYEPAAAWTETTGSHPSADAMYSINADVVDGDVDLALRARAEAEKDAYAYLDVLVLCRYATGTSAAPS